jgi:uncharacterized protein (TIGR03435 family)
MKRRWTCVAALALIPFAVNYGQEAAAPLKFEVASIRASKPGQRNGGIKALPGGQEYVAQNFPVRMMIALMYKVPARQILGGPDWITDERFDVDAKADKGYTLDDLHLMYQNLLAERFGLRFHKEIKEGNVYALTVEKGGTKMKRNESAQDFEIPIQFSANGVMNGKRVPMPYFCWNLGQILQNDQRPVIDRTGLEGNWDFTLTFAPVLPPDVSRESLPPEVADRPSLFDALRDQLGLRLTAQKGPVEYYVIDHIEKPIEN